MNIDAIKECTKKLTFEMTASRDLGRLCAHYMDIEQEQLLYISAYIEEAVRKADEHSELINLLHMVYLDKGVTDEKCHRVEVLLNKYV